MAGSGYAVVSLDDAAWSTTPGSPARAFLTEPLGATETTVDAYRIEPDETVALESAREHLLVPLATTVRLAESATVSQPGVARVPAGVETTVSAAASTTVLAIGVPSEPTPDATPTAVDLETVEFTIPSTSAVATAFLTGRLGCAGMKVNARRLEPGQAVPYHTEGTQEELFIPVRGPAALRVDDTTHTLRTGSVARVAPPVPRGAANEADTDALWVMVGAPPTGGPTDWDPGAAIVE